MKDKSKSPRVPMRYEIAGGFFPCPKESIGVLIITKVSVEDVIGLQCGTDYVHPVSVTGVSV